MIHSITESTSFRIVCKPFKRVATFFDIIPFYLSDCDGVFFKTSMWTYAIVKDTVMTPRTDLGSNGLF